MARYARKILVPSLAVLATVSLAACSGGNVAASGGDAQGGSKAVKIGVSVPLSGVMSTDGKSTLCGADAYFNTINAKGGVNGITFETDATDNKYDPALAAQIAREYAANDTFALLTIGTGVLAASTPVAQSVGIPIVGSADGASVTPGLNGVYGYNPVYGREGAAGADFISEKLDATDAAVVYFSPAADAGAAAFAERFKANGGNVVLSEPSPSSVTDYAPLAQKLKNSGATVVYTMLVDAQISGLQKAAAAIGYTPDWVGWAITYGPSYLELAGEAAEGTYVASWVIPMTETDDPDVATFIKAVNDIPDCAPLLGTSAVASGYAMAAMIAYGVEKSTANGAAPNVEGFNAALSNVKDQQFGITPGASLDSSSHALVRQSSFWQVKGDGLIPIRDFKPLPE